MIRIKNIDYGPTGMRRSNSVTIAVPSATTKYPVFIAPVDCVVDSVSFLATGSASAQVAVKYGDSAASSVMGVLSQNVSILTNYSIPITGVNSLTAGQVVLFTVSATSGLSETVVTVNYTPQKHRGTR